MPDKVKVIYRRFPVPSDRRPRKIMPGDYFAVLVGEPANYGKVAMVSAYTDGGTSWTIGEIDTLSFQNCPRIKDDTKIPASLVDYLKWNPDGEEPFALVRRHRLTYQDRRDAWDWHGKGDS